MIYMNCDGADRRRHAPTTTRSLTGSLVLQILGKVHMAPMEINGHHFPLSIAVMEQDGMDFLLGLDNLKRHQCSIDLQKNVLRFPGMANEQDLEMPFLQEHEIKKWTGSETRDQAEGDAEKGDGGKPAAPAPPPPPAASPSPSPAPAPAPSLPSLPSLPSAPSFPVDESGLSARRLHPGAHSCQRQRGDCRQPPLLLTRYCYNVSSLYRQPELLCIRIQSAPGELGTLEPRQPIRHLHLEPIDLGDHLVHDRMPLRNIRRHRIPLRLERR